MIDTHGVRDIQLRYRQKKPPDRLIAHVVTHGLHDFKKQGRPIAEGIHWMAALGHGRLLNRCGAIWHKPGEFTQAKVNDAASAKAIRPINSSVIKRPFMVWPDGKVTVGFDASAWFALFQAH